MSAETEKQLYTVEVGLLLVVLAKGPAEARKVAMRHAAEEVKNGNLYTEYLLPVHGIEDVPDGWRDAIPWGAGDERTCRERLEGEH